MNYNQIAEKLIDLQNADLALREKLVKSGRLSEGYDEEMKALHNRNAKLLNEIIAVIGYPTVEKVGKEASEAAWLVIQHAIEQPQLMKKCAELLRIEVAKGNAEPKSLAYLYDRIAVFEGKSQLYGTQFDWDENGELSPNAFDDLVEVNKRRSSVGLDTLEEQTALIRANAKKENQQPPKDLEKRRQEVEAWKKKVGWIR
ncbi:DUF6624 domain-containing protein [Pedobacter xixiisoli]|nr:DUF6624 domain-containing protein [Pedobacter xixiisoli]